jgi:hypothetical protein
VVDVDPGMGDGEVPPAYQADDVVVPGAEFLQLATRDNPVLPPGEEMFQLGAGEHVGMLPRAGVWYSGRCRPVDDA